MPRQPIMRFPASHRGGVLVAMLLLLGQLALIDRAHPQGAPSGTEPPPASFAPPADATPPAAARPSPGSGGLLDKLGDWLRDSAEGVSTGLKDTQQKMQDINKGTLETLTNMPVGGLAMGRALCPRSANGAPDCYAATEKLCKDKGYSSGRSLDTESAETCNPRVYLPGYQRKEGDCRVETFVTRAACQ